MKELFYIVVFYLSTYQPVDCPPNYKIDPLTKEKVVVPTLEYCTTEVRDTFDLYLSEAEYLKWSRIANVSFREVHMITLIEVNGEQKDTLILNGNRK